MSEQENNQSPWEAAGISKRTWYRWRAIERGGEQVKRKSGPRGPRGRYSKSYYMANREKFRGYALGYNFANIEKMLLWCAKSRAKKKNIPCNIDITDVVVPTTCPVLGIPVFRTPPVAGEIKHNKPNSPSLDRIIPELGYVKGNVRVISWRANNLKRDGTLEEFKAIVRYLESGGDQ